MKRAVLAAARQPIVHFAALGALLFAAHALVSSEDAAAERRRVAFSAEQLSGVSPNAIDQLVTEEILYREAMAIGLDRGDPVVRRRLVQKMEFLLEGVQAPPTDAELQAYLDAHAADYRLPARVTFEHVYFARNRRDDPAGDARAFVAAPGDPAAAGDSFVAGRRFEAHKQTTVAGLFGDAFAAALFAAPVGQWSGPVESKVGVHAVRVIDRVPDRAATIDDVRGPLVAEYTRQRREQTRRAAIAELVESYDVHVPQAEPARE